MTLNKITKRVIFTLNNYDETELDSLRTYLQNADEVRYAIFGKEVGKETGTPHLQGYISCTKPKRLFWFKKVGLQRAHLTVPNGNEEEQYKYCSKDGDFEEFGSRAEPGKRTDLENFKDAVKAGEYRHHVLIEEHSKVYAHCRRFCDEYVLKHAHANVPRTKLGPLRHWQQELDRILKLAPNDRDVIFIVDPKGAAGKTSFAKYYNDLHPDDTLYLRCGKVADMAYVLPPKLRVLFIDCTREQLERLPYSFIECVKDGRVLSTKFHTVLKQYDNVHVVVLTNDWPSKNGFSHDRFQMYLIGDDGESYEKREIYDT